ncbi:hypothetical protein CPB84DRAFT_241465 [Gymnopilus junonius]|uniref:Wax synthase domain-containing protein n=1 Tax=Gymnopilus junonius TaxID=109634 RepID=A0A9P5NWN9_GYMJU|nr:hypothetical protein CPB84DRAFT_241465 [Gymnopilus junonius]
MPAPNDGSKPAFKPAVWFILEALLNLSYAVKPSKYRWLFFLSISTIIVYSLLFTRMDDLWHLGMPEWGIGCRISSILFLASTNILLCDVQRELRLVGQKGTFRANHCSSAFVPRHSIPPYLIRDHWRREPCEPILFSGAARLVSKLWRLAVFFHGMLIYVILETQYKLASLLSVSLVLTEPRDWPDLFGSYKYGFTLRGFWGKTWHQMFRRMAVTHGRFFPKRSVFPKEAISSLSSSFIARFSFLGHCIMLAMR